MKAYVFPGQGAQFPGMGKDLYERSGLAKELFETANSILGFRITDLMFTGSDEDLKQTRVTQPSIFLHSVILAGCWTGMPWCSKLPAAFESLSRGVIPAGKF